MTSPKGSIRLPAALLLVDLQRGITALPTVDPIETVLERASALADAFRAHGQLVVRVRVAFSPDGADALHAPVDVAPPLAPGPDFSELDPRVPVCDGDLQIIKRGWDAFHGTELDLQLRRRGVRTVVLAGLITSIGVEGAGRSASALGYELITVADAVADVAETAQCHSLQRILPRLGRVIQGGDLIDALRAGAGDLAPTA